MLHTKIYTFKSNVDREFTNSKYTAVTAEQKEIIGRWLQEQHTWPSVEAFNSLLSSFLHTPCTTFGKRGATDKQNIERLQSVTASISIQNLKDAATQASITSFWNANKRRLLPLAKVSSNQALLASSMALLKLPANAVNKFWHSKRLRHIEVKGELYRLGLTNCVVCKLNMVKIVGGKCTRPEHNNITKAKEAKNKQDAEHKKR